MGRTLDELLRNMPPEERANVETRRLALIDEVEGLRALRHLADRSQGEIAAALGVKQPSVHKIERQSDLYLSTLRRFVEAAGGSLEIRVELPGRQPLRLLGVGDLRAPDAPEVPPARFAEERASYEGWTEAEAGMRESEPVGKSRPKRARRGAAAWKAPSIRRMRAGDAELKHGREPVLLAS